MNMDTFIIRASRHELKYYNGKNFLGSFCGIKLKDFDPTQLMKLESLITGDDLFDINNRGYNIIGYSTEGITYIDTSPQLLKALRTLTFSKKIEVLDKWCRCKEMQLYHSSPIKAAEVLDWLIKSSRDIDAFQKPLIVCMDNHCYERQPA